MGNRKTHKHFGSYLIEGSTDSQSSVIMLTTRLATKQLRVDRILGRNALNGFKFTKSAREGENPAKSARGVSWWPLNRFRRTKMQTPQLPTFCFGSKKHLHSFTLVDRTAKKCICGVCWIKFEPLNRFSGSHRCISLGMPTVFEAPMSGTALSTLRAYKRRESA